MYNKTMKKISVFLILALFLSVQVPSEAGIIKVQKAKIEQVKTEKTKVAEIKALFGEMLKQANKHSLTGLQSVYSKDFVNSDGFNYDIYMKMVEDTWKTYPDIMYSTKIEKIEFSDNYARVLVTETAVAAPKEQIGEFQTVGELYSVSKCIYHLEKHGTIWLISSEDMLEETSTLKYGGTRYIQVGLDTPKQIGADKYYTATLKINVPEGFNAIASIGREKIIYPQTRIEDNFRRVPNDNVLERVFLSNKDNVNEYAIASVGLAHAEEQEKDLKVYMDGLAFIMTRVNVIPENKFVNIEDKKVEKNEQSK